MTNEEKKWFCMMLDVYSGDFLIKPDDLIVYVCDIASLPKYKNLTDDDLNDICEFYYLWKHGFCKKFKEALRDE